MMSCFLLIKERNITFARIISKLLNLILQLLKYHFYLLTNFESQNQHSPVLKAGGDTLPSFEAKGPFLY